MGRVLGGVGGVGAVPSVRVPPFPDCATREAGKASTKLVLAIEKKPHMLPRVQPSLKQWLTYLDDKNPHVNNGWWLYEPLFLDDKNPYVNHKEVYEPPCCNGGVNPRLLPAGPALRPIRSIRSEIRDRMAATTAPWKLRSSRTAWRSIPQGRVLETPGSTCPCGQRTKAPTFPAAARFGWSFGTPLRWVPPLLLFFPFRWPPVFVWVVSTFLILLFFVVSTFLGGFPPCWRCLRVFLGPLSR